MTARVVHIEKKSLEVSANARSLQRALRSHVNQDLTAADAATLSGLPLEQSREALLHLVAHYPSRVQVSQSGDLIFRFRSLTKSRLPSGFVKVWRRIEPWLADKWETLLALMTLLLLPPFLLSVAGHSLAIVDVCGSTWNCWPAYGVAWAFGFAGIVCLTLFQVVPLGVLVSVAGGMALLFYPFEKGVDFPLALFPMALGGVLLGVAAKFFGWCCHLWEEMVDGKSAAWARTLWRQVGGAVLGAPVQVPDALADERRLTALIEHQNGILTVGDLMALFGWNLDQADSELTRILVDYGGDIVVSEEGAIAYRFDPMRLRRTASPLAEDLSPVYEQNRPWQPFFDCPNHVWIILLTAIAFGCLGLAIHPDLALFPSFKQMEEGLEEVFTKHREPIFMQAAGAYLYLLALVPMGLRALWRLGKALMIQRQRRFWQVLQLAVEKPEGSYPKGVSNRDVARLGGTWDLDRSNDDGLPCLIFPALVAARQAAAWARDTLSPADPETIIYVSGETKM